jgi:hypothetical protein
VNVILMASVLDGRARGIKARAEITRPGRHAEGEPFADFAATRAVQTLVGPGQQQDAADAVKQTAQMNFLYQEGAADNAAARPLFSLAECRPLRPPVLCDILQLEPRRRILFESPSQLITELRVQSSRIPR